MPKVVALLDPRVLIVCYGITSPCNVRLVLTGGLAQVALRRDLWLDAADPIVRPQPCCPYGKEEATGFGVTSESLEVPTKLVEVDTFFEPAPVPMAAGLPKEVTVYGLC